MPASPSPAAPSPRPGTVKARLTPKRPRRQVENDASTPHSSGASCAPAAVASETETSRPWPSCSAWPTRSTPPCPRLRHAGRRGDLAAGHRDQQRRSARRPAGRPRQPGLATWLACCSRAGHAALSPRIHRSRVDNYLDAIPSGSSRRPPNRRHFGLVNGHGPVMRLWACPGTAPPSRRICTVHPQALCTATYTHDLARVGVIGACSHAGPGCRQGPRASLPRPDTDHHSLPLR